MSKIKVEDEKTIKMGTIWMITSSKIFVLDVDGFIHDCDRHEIYDV